MTSYLHDAAVAGFSALMVIAGFEELHRFIFPSPLTVPLLLLRPVYAVAAPGLVGTLRSFGCSAAVVILSPNLH